MAGLKDSVARRGRRAWSSFAELVGLHYELFRVEAREERNRLVRLIVQSMVATLAGFAAFVFLNVLLILYFYEWRFQVLVSLIVFYLLLTVWVGFGLRRAMKQTPSPFSATIDEIRKDRAIFGSES